MMRSLLFVPADSSRKLDKALSSGADALILDLEDSIAPDRKQAARELAAGFMREVASEQDRPRLYVRLNGFASNMLEEDLEAILPHAPEGVVLPKSLSGGCISKLARLIDERGAKQTGIIAIATESAEALFGLGSYKQCSPRLEGLAWGGEDLSADVGAEAHHDEQGAWTSPYCLARNLCLFGATAAGVPAFDTIYAAYQDLEGLHHEAKAACRDGFSGKLAIHPDQIPVIHAAFVPSPEKIAEAKAIIAAFEQNDATGVASLKKNMVDRPHLLRARLILARAQTSRR